MIPNEVKALWGIELSPRAKAHQHAKYRTERATGDADRMAVFWRMLLD
jgi:hypothetical protein